MMIEARDRAFVKPKCNFSYNVAIILLSVIVIVFIGGTRTLGFIGDSLEHNRRFWETIVALNDNFNCLGFVNIDIFLVTLVLSYAIHKVKRLEDLEIMGSTRA